MDSDYQINLNNYVKITKIDSYNSLYDLYKIKDEKTGNFYLAATLLIDNQYIKKNIYILPQINHPLITKYIGYSPTDLDGNKQLTLISDFVSSTTLDDVMNLEKKSLAPSEWNDTQKLKVIISIASVMTYIHSINFVFEYLQPSVLLMDDDYLPHISIFSLIKTVDDGTIQNNFSVYPVLYCSPEIIDDIETVSYPTDVYTFSMILYQLFMKRIPFFDLKSAFQIMRYICKNKRPKFDNSIPISYRNLIESCWQQDPEKRPKFEQILNELQNDPKYITENMNKEAIKKFINDQINKEKVIEPKESGELKKKNDELESKIKEYESVLLPSPQSKEDNYFIDNEEDSKFFENKGRIGEGATAITYKVIDKRTKTPLCKKVIKIGKEQTTIKDAQNALKEFEVLHLINHPCICKSFYINTSEVIQIVNKGKTDEVTTIAIYLEHLEYGLGEILRSNIINNTMKVKIVIEIAHAMNHLHKKGMMHRDLKIENIMLNAVYQAKLVDFGLVRINECVLNNYSFVEDSLTKGIGTFSCMSPEMLNEENYDNKTDVYSFGVVLHFMFIGSIPKQSLKDKTTGKKISLPSPSSSASKFCLDLIAKCLSPDSSDRPSFDEILDDLRKNSFDLSDDVDPSILVQRDRELEIIEKIK